MAVSLFNQCLRNVIILNWMEWVMTQGIKRVKSFITSLSAPILFHLIGLYQNGVLST